MPVVLTVNGRPVVALTPLQDGDWVSTAEMRRRLKQRRADAEGS